VARSRPAKIGVAAVAVAAAATAIGSGVASSGSRSHASSQAVTRHPSTTTTTTTVPTATTTVDSVPPGTPIDVPGAGVGVGSTGPAVLAIKQRLVQLRYDPVAMTDRFDYDTYYAVIAFQKVHDLPRTGRVTPDVAADMVNDALATPMIPGAEPDRVEIDLARQVLYFWQAGKLVRILPVSTGFGGHYCGDDGSCGIATTPTGAYRAASKILGEHKSPLGELWNPVFFNGGIAIHGEPSVPATPASHGCVRIPMDDSMWMYHTLALGTPVYVRDDTHVPVPFNQGGTVGPPQPGGTPPTVPHPTSTGPPRASTTQPAARPPSTPSTTTKAPSSTVPRAPALPPSPTVPALPGTPPTT
jgi:lipoprotein-anchoring transpeptidase ErfK/SrfK